MSSPDLFLASRSPRRRELLSQISVNFEVVNTEVIEERRAGELPVDYVKRLAREKAQAGREVMAKSSKPVMGADTIVVLKERVIEKPLDQAHAAQLLGLLSGQTHEVITAVSLCSPEHEKTIISSTWVSFRPIDEDEIEKYWTTGEPRDKAGAYAIQGLGAVFVKKLEGSYSNVVGLPLYETSVLLREFSVPCWSSYLS